MKNPSIAYSNDSSELSNLNDFLAQTNYNLNNLNYPTFGDNNINNNSFSNKKKLNNSNDGKEEFTNGHTSESEAEEDDTLLIDKIINDYGYKWQTIKVFLCSFMIFILNEYFINNPVTYYSVLKNKMKVSSSFMMYFNSLSSISRAIGAFSCGYILTLKSITRKRLIYFFVWFMLLNNIMITINYNLSLYIIFLILGCFAAGTLDVVAVNILCESLPIFLRGSFICMSLFGYLLSDLINNILIKLFSDKDNIDVRAVLMIMNGIFIFFLILFYFLRLSDSARNLLLKGDHHEAFAILQKLKGSDLTQEEKAELVKDEKYINKVNNEKDIDNTDEEKNNLLKKERQLESAISQSNKQSRNKTYLDSLKQIFSKRFLKTTGIFLTIRFLLTTVIGGSSSTLGLYLSKILDQNDANKINSAQLFLNIITVFSYPLSALLMEVKFLGRRSTLIILSGMSLITLVFIFLFQHVFYLLGILFLIFSSKTNTILTVTSETYPTRVRDITSGFFNIIEVFGEVLGIVMYNLLIKKFILAPYIANFGIVSVCFVLFFFLDYETKDKPLDFVFKEDDLKFYISSKDVLGKIRAKGYQSN